MRDLESLGSDRRASAPEPARQSPASSREEPPTEALSAAPERDAPALDLSPPLRPMNGVKRQERRHEDTQPRRIRKERHQEPAEQSFMLGSLVVTLDLDARLLDERSRTARPKDMR